MQNDATTLDDTELFAELSEQRALHGEAVANDYGAVILRDATARIEELEAEIARRGL